MAEPISEYQAVEEPHRERIHAVIVQDKGVFVAECLEIAVVTQGKTMDEVLFHLKDAIGLHLEGEDPSSLGLSANPRLVVTFELSLDNAPAA